MVNLLRGALPLVDCIAENALLFADGDISYHSGELKKALGNFDVYAQRFVEMLDEPVFAKYPDFKEFLNHLSVATCQGCRKRKMQVVQKL